MKFFLILFLTVSCEFRLSPYTTDVPKLELNVENLKRIKAQENENPGNFRIAFLSDTHNHYKDLKKAVDYINRNGPYDFVVINGDTSIIGLSDEFLASKKYFEDINAPFLVSVGNHDLLSNGNRIYDKLYGPRNFSFTYKGVNFVFFDSNNWESDIKAPDIDYVQGTLKGTANILIAHVPLNDHDRFTDDEINDWATLTNHYNIPYMFAGHNHNPNEEMLWNSLLITIGSPPKRTLWELQGAGGVVSHQKTSF